MTVFAVMAMDSRQVARHGRIDPPDAAILPTLIYGLFGMLIALPAAVISYR